MVPEAIREEKRGVAIDPGVLRENLTEFLGDVGVGKWGDV